MRRLLFLTLIALAVAAAGCGGKSAPSAEEYEQSVVLMRDRVDFALERITKSESEDQFLERMDEASETIERAADDLDGAGTAEDFEDEHEKLVSSLRQLSYDVKATADQIRIPGFEGLLTGSRGISFESWDQVNSALAGMAGKGMDVSMLQRH